MPRLFQVLGVSLYVLAIATVFVSAHVSGYENALETMTREGGFFEWISVILLFGIGVLGLSWVVRCGVYHNRWFMFGATAFALLALVAGMEEISWGQHLFHFESGVYFKAHNYQQETNLHNFIPAEIFSSAIYSSVYAVFVFIPLFMRLLASRVRLFASLQGWLPSLHVSLTVLFGALFQAYFYDNFGAWFDFGTLLAGLLVFAVIVSLLKLWGRRLAAHFVVVLAALVLFMVSHEVFGFFNMQYEIREMFVVLASLIYFHAVLQRISDATAKSH